MNFSAFVPPGPGAAGFTVVAGREHGLSSLMLVGGRLPVGNPGPVHVHDGDEVLRMIRGRMRIRLGDEVRLCGAGDVVAVPSRVRHGFEVIEETVLEVVSEYDIFG